MSTLRIALVGDYTPSITAHRAIPMAIGLAAKEAAIEVAADWVATDSIAESADNERRLGGYAGIWCAPGSPYRSAAGALAAIRYARERAVPFLGTCGGFQHAVLEHARAVLGWQDAAHAEEAPEAPLQVIAPLTCELVEKSARIRLKTGTRLAQAYGSAEAEETYQCRYGVNPRLGNQVCVAGLIESAFDDNGETRAVELPAHPFFVATLFQPERAALQGSIPPIVRAFVQAACRFTPTPDC